MKHLIIGNGAAGIAAAERIRKLDKASGIAILSAEKYPVYSRCLLPYYLSGQLPEERMYIRDRDFYKKKNIDIYYNHKVVSVDFKLKKVYTGNTDNFNENGSVFEYDKLLVASGSTPVLPPIGGLDFSNTYFLNTFDDAKRILEDSRGA